MRRRRLGLTLIFGAGISLAAVSTAWACGVLATLKLNASTAAPGQTLTATGANYSPSPSFSAVSIRWDSRTGAVLKETAPDPSGRINTTFNVPANATAGSHVVMATQTRLSDGTPKSGTPGRTSLQVQGTAASASPWSSSKPSGPGGSGASVVALDGAGSASPTFPTLLGIALSLALLGTGLTLVGRGRTRTANRPSLGA